jgi:transposase
MAKCPSNKDTKTDVKITNNKSELVPADQEHAQSETIINCNKPKTIFQVGSQQRERDSETLRNISNRNDLDKFSRTKVMVVLMRLSGICVPQVAEVTGAGVRRISAYTKEYCDNGIEGLLFDQRYKQVSDLMSYKETIVEDFKSNPPATSAEAATRIEILTGLKRSTTQVRNFMHACGMKCLKAGHIPAKANPEEQKKFLDEQLMPVIEKAQKDEVVLFMDAAHIIWQVYLGVLWCFERIFVRAASGRKRLNILGAYDPIGNLLHKICTMTYITSTTVCEMLVKVRQYYQGKKITIVLDNVRYQRCKLVMDEAKKLGIELLFLPTYSPNLNLIERLWRFVKKECLYSKYYPTYEQFDAAVMNSLDSISTTNKDRIKSLMSLKFQMFK